MAEEAGETKPKLEGKIINLIVKDQTGAEVHFKASAKWGGGVNLCWPAARTNRGYDGSTGCMHGARKSWPQLRTC